MSGTCACCGHSKNGHQSGDVCSLCEDAILAIRLLPNDVRPHVLIRAAGGSMKDAAKATGTRAQDNDYALTKAKKALGCSREYLLLVARYGLATKRLPLPEGFERPDYVTPTHDTPAPRIQPRPEIPVPPSGPVVVEHRDPEPIKQEEEQVVQIDVHGDMGPEQARKIAAAIAPEPALNVVAQDAIKGLLAKFKTEAADAGMDYQCAFAELAHLVLTGEGLPDMKLVQLAYQFGAAKGRVEALEALV